MSWRATGATATATLVVLSITVALTGCAMTHVALRTPAPMSTSEFWSTIDAARVTTDPTGPSAEPGALKKQLESLSGEKVAAFAERYDATMVQLNRWTIWDAGYAAAQGMTDDDFDYFRAWLIGKGSTVVAQAEFAPDDLGKYFTSIDSSKDDFDNESLDYVADDILMARYGQKADDKFDAKFGADTDDAPPGKETDEKSIASRYPKLTAWAKAHDH